MATATALPVATRIGAMATADTATAAIGRAMESSAAKPAGARYGVQATFAVDGYIETPNSRPSALNLPGRFGPLQPVPIFGPRAATTKVSHLPHCDYFRQRGRSGSGREV